MTALQRLPLFEVAVDGAELPARLQRSLVALRVHQHLARPSVCELVFAGVDDSLLDAALRIGARLRATPRDAGGNLFDGRVTAIEYGHAVDGVATVSVRAYDALFTLRNRQTVRAHVGLTLAELAQELTADLGLIVAADENGPTWPRLLQTGSDLELLCDVAARCGMYPTLDDGVLHLLTLAGRGSPVLLTIDDNLLEARIEVNANGACRKVTADGWDPRRGALRSGLASSARGARSASAEAAASSIGGSDERRLTAGVFQDDDQARAWAQAELDARSAQEVVFGGTALGDARLRPGARVKVAGVAARAAGEYVIASARHTLDAERGYQTEVSSAPPPQRLQAQGTQMTLGQISDIADPDHLGRVRAVLPAYAGVETDWLQVVAAGAGNGKGLVAFPDVGDLVLLLLDRSDASQAVVLGSLYGEAGLPEPGKVLGKDASFCFLTPGGQCIRLDDAARALRMESADGSWLELTPEGVKLHSKTPLTIEAPGQKMLLRARQIDFERE